MNFLFVISMNVIFIIFINLFVALFILLLSYQFLLNSSCEPVVALSSRLTLAAPPIAWKHLLEFLLVSIDSPAAVATSYFTTDTQNQVVAITPQHFIPRA